MRIITLSVALLVLGCARGSRADSAQDRARAVDLMQQGNHAEAFALLQTLALGSAADAEDAVHNDLRMGYECLQHLGRLEEIDRFVEDALLAHPRNWRVLRESASLYREMPHQGFLIAGEFRRGGHRGGGQGANAWERDRVRSLQLMLEAIAGAEETGAAPGDRTQLFLQAAETVMLGRDAWQMQALTNLDELPEPEEQMWFFGPYGRGGGDRGAPVDPEGNPVYYQVPESFEAAVCDGERWRWFLDRAAAASAEGAAEARMRLARFLHGQFGVQTLARFGPLFGRGQNEPEVGRFAVQTLNDHETLARLATGVKRFDLPEEFRFIALFETLAGDTDRRNLAEQATRTLADIYENRRQYARAAEWWERYERFDADQARARLEQIRGNWGQFEPVRSQAAGGGATVDFRFRNAERLELTAYRIRVPELLADVKDYLRSAPSEPDHRRMQVEDIGFRLVHEGQDRYLGDEVARWDLDLDPRPGHLDRRITIETPLREAGAYLLVGQVADGSTARVVLWVEDTALVRKPLQRATLVFVGDAGDGRPIEGAVLEFFGYRYDRIRETRRMAVDLRNFAERTDADGLAVVDGERMPDRYNWLITATTADGRLAFSGFNHIWLPQSDDPEYDAVRSIVISDRPVYRPGDTVHMHAWIRHARYDQAEVSEFAGHTFVVEVQRARGDKAGTWDLVADEFGGVSWDLDLEPGCDLGVYSIQVRERDQYVGNGSFRVEEYKKPEFEVTVDAPEEPVSLGEIIRATVRADYYFGAPVTQATVRVKVTRTARTEVWYPICRWDWLYGRGYAWLGQDYLWYPGWHSWGHPAPAPWWFPQRQFPPELVLETEGQIGPDGSYSVEIDTALAAELHSDTDHRYEITAEVVDRSRRTIVGTGSVLAAREPFEVTVWLDRGYCRVGDTVTGQVQARTPDGKPVTGRAEMQLLRIRYDRQGEPREEQVRRWSMDMDSEGRAEDRITASHAGQYRLACTVTDSLGHRIEGGSVFTVRGEGFDGRNFRYNTLELVPEQAEYDPGQSLRLLVNTDRVGATVLLFVRPANGVYQRPRVLRLQGKSMVVDLPVTRRDMPNFFVEGLVVDDGEVHQIARQVVVPPEKRVMDVEVLAAEPRLGPGDEAEVTLRLRDRNGEPVVGSTVVAVYDKSVEYIAGGSAVPDIRKVFWEWRRHHNPMSESNLGRTGRNLLKEGETPMHDLGVFGGSVADDGEQGMMLGMGGGFGGRGESRLAFGAPAAMMADSAMPEMAKGAAAPPAPGFGGGANAAADAGTVQVRKEFADTALWLSRLETDTDGIARVHVPMPENLTTWKVCVWAMSHGTRVGEGSTELITTKDLIVRLQAPRFFVDTDEVVLSANVHNYLPSARDVEVSLATEGGQLRVEGERSQTVRIESHGEARVDWWTRVRGEGETLVRVMAVTDDDSDALEMRFPVYVHGMDKLDAVCGMLRPGDEQLSLALEIPEKRRPATTWLDVRVSPSLAMAMVDALPYLIAYPHGCTEQTLNRFLPTLVTQKVLQGMGVDLDAVRDKRTNLNPQELGDAAERAAQWGLGAVDPNPVFDPEEVGRMVRAGVDRLTEMQLGDGGWGWFSGWGERSSAHTTAQVVHGLVMARELGVALVPGVLERGVEWLRNHQAEEVRKLRNSREEPRIEPWKERADETDALVFRVLAEAGADSGEMWPLLDRDRVQLAPYGLALLGLGLHSVERFDERDMVLRNLRQFLVTDAENQTAYLRLPTEGYWWFWWGDEIETQAAFLKLMVLASPGDEVAPWLVKYLLNNRKHATYWRSTRDTAAAVEAFAAYIQGSGESAPDLEVEILVNGRELDTVAITAENLFSFRNSFVLEGERVPSGVQDVQIRKRGRGPLYVNVYARYFTLEDFIPASGLEIKVRRSVYRLQRKEDTALVQGVRGQAIHQARESYERVPLDVDDTVTSGDLVEVELVIESKNDYEYLVFEDWKGAGFEPVELRSGYGGNAMGAYVEYRDERVCFYVRRLARGRHSLSYRLRAEIPGRFSLLPARGWAMYAPELRGNSDEFKVVVEDRDP